MADFLNIPGNIRQQYLPFVISKSGEKQIFTFKEKHRGKRNTAIIHPFSKHFSSLLANDSSFQYTHGPNGPTKVTYAQFLDEIPSVQIREYFPDAKLTQTFKWFSYLRKGFEHGISDLNSLNLSISALKDKGEELWKKLQDAMRDLTSANAPLLKKIVGNLSEYYRDAGYNIGDDDGFAVLFLPFLLYYRMTTTTTNNIYEIPYSLRNPVMRSDGTYGWSGGNQSDFGLVDKVIGGNAAGAGTNTASNSIERLLLGNTVKINIMPSFQPTNEIHTESIEISIDLINDSEEAAVNNFLLCHTIFGNSRWLQYGFVQAGSCLYDVKLPGANRYFMCSANLTCTAKGAFRSPSGSVLQDILNHAQTTNTVGTVISKLASGNRDEQELYDAVLKSEIKSMLERAKYFESNTARSMRAKKAAANQSKMRAAKAANTSNEAKATKTLTESSAAPKPEESVTSIFTVDKDIKDLQSKIKDATETKSTVSKLKGEIESLEEEFRKQNEIRISEKSTSEDKTAAENRQRQLALETMDKMQSLTAIVTEHSIVGDSTRLTEKIELLDNSDIDDVVFAMIEEDPVSTVASAVEDQTNQEMDIVIRKNEEELEILKKIDSQVTAMGGLFSGTVSVEKLKPLIKIPDVYSIKMVFSPLLPDNFNNYLFGYRADALDPIEDYGYGYVNEKGIFEDLVDNLEKNL